MPTAMFSLINMKNITTPLGGICMIDKIEKEYGLITELFSNIGESSDFIGRVKVLLNNKLTYSTSVLQIPNMLDPEVLPYFSLNHISDRSLNRTVEKIGRFFPIIQERYQNFLEKKNLVDKIQNLDWTSASLEGTMTELAAYGYSKDKRPDRRQIAIGLSVGSNTIPVAITIQKGNMNDKKHFEQTYRIVKRVMQKGSLLVFDCGANTIENKVRITDDGYEYLTLRPKHVGTYKKHLDIFNHSAPVTVIVKPKDSEKMPQIFENGEEQPDKELDLETGLGRTYLCVKIKDDHEFKYVYFSKDLFDDQIRKKEKKFTRQIEKGNKLIKKAKAHKAIDTIPSDVGWIGLYPEVQKTLKEIENPYVNGLEGFFILESSVDTTPADALQIYKDRGKAEKFIRDLKEGMELGPIRHWTTDAIIGIVFLSFLAKSVESLTLLSAKIPID
ncbi:transposase, partial [mine drainage metagenome]